jgi:hypothetical protein
MVKCDTASDGGGESGSKKDRVKKDNYHAETPENLNPMVGFSILSMVV